MNFPVSKINEELVPAKNGWTVSAGQTVLHSRYNPLLEAEKYASSFEKKYRYFILIEPGLPYLARALQKRFPASRIITLHCSAFFSALGENGFVFSGEDSGPSWDPSSQEGLEDFLEEHIRGAAGIKIVEWRPSVNAYGRACLELAERTVECIRRISANLRTMKNFGRRWLRNALKNLELLEKSGELFRGESPVLVCAAGPGLEAVLPGLRGRKEPGNPFVISLSSAVPALAAAGVQPDMVIAADGGNWARFHLFESVRNFPSVPLAAALSAALPSQFAAGPLLVLSDGSLWQQFLLRSCRIPFLTFPQRGTVSASALDLAFFASTGPVYIAGLDLSHRDMLTHARPYAFEKLLDAAASRQRPFYSQAFERERIISDGGSHGIYAAWFRTYLRSYPPRLYSLSGETGIPRGTPASLWEIPEKPGPRFCGTSREGTSRKTGAGILLKALSDPLLSKQILRELGELLFTEDTENPPEEKESLGMIREELGSYLENHG